MKTCLFCQNTRLFNIHKHNENNYHTIKDDMITFFGYDIQSSLHEDDAICNLCMTIMDGVAQLKRQLLPLIFRSSAENMDEDQKPLNLGRKWHLFASMNYRDTGDSPVLRAPTPSLMHCTQVVPYKKARELKKETEENYRSLSRQTTAGRSTTSDGEVSRTYSRRSRKRRRGHNWTRPKGGRISRMSMYTDYDGSRSMSRSTTFLEHYYDVDDDDDDNEYEEQPEVVHIHFDEMFECFVPNCIFFSPDLDDMTKHQINRHKKLALYFCNLCDQKCTDSRHLTTHKKRHLKEYSCIICYEEFYLEEDLRDHWQYHYKTSIPCEECGKRFLNKVICKKHIENVHRSNTIHRFDFMLALEESFYNTSDFEIRNLIQVTLPLEIAKDL